ncbi:MAG: RnfABCDGE type electron transport complex subunit D, partial [Clostridia bacterium]|nr:RnfABCDGE type electron transport complex subunit D [Clostridia bacterium]
GQMIGVSLCADIPLLSSISGKVDGIVRIGERDYVSIQNDGKYEQSKEIPPIKTRLSEISRDEMVQRLRLCGIKEWRTFENSAHFKRLAVNCIERDVYSSAKKCIIQKRHKELVGGAKIIMKLTGLRLCEFVIERSETDSINCLIDGIAGSSLFDIVEVRGACTAFDDTRVINELPSAEELSASELLILSPETLSAVYRAFAGGEPYIKRAVTVSGAISGANGTYILPLGTPISSLYDAFIGDGSADTKVVENGVMTGVITDEHSRVITYDTHSLTFISERELTVRTDACIGCTRCDKVCPEKLLPSLFIENCGRDYEQAVSSSGMDWCSDCGACSYVCPARIPIQEIAKDRSKILKPNERHKTRSIKTAPFIRSSVSIRDINLDYLIVLCALLAFSTALFGAKALISCAVGTLAAVLCDVLFSRLTNTSVLSPANLSSAVCGLMLSLTMTAQTPVYVTAIGSFFAVMIIRGAFGGCAKNILHSVFCARIFVSLIYHDSFIHPEGTYTVFERLLGNTPGGYGEVSVVMLCACAVYLAIRKLLPMLTLASTLSTFVVITFLTAEAGGARERLISATFGSAILF